MKKFFSFILICAGLTWAYFWYVRGENLLMRGAETSAAPAYAYAEKIPPRAQPKWESAAPMPTVRSGASAAAIGRKVYVVGGFDGFARSLDAVEAFDVRANSWEKLAPLPKPVHYPAVASDGKSLYVFGGLTGLADTPTDSMWIFDPAKGEWKAGPDLPDPIGAAAVEYHGGEFHLLGGIGLGSSTQAHQVFDPVKGAWRSDESLVSGRDHFAAVALKDHLFVVGGRGGSLLYNMDDLETYDAVSHSWEQRERLPVKRSAHGAVELGGHIVAFGGESASSTYDDLYEYDPKTDRWRIGVAMPTARYGFAYAVSEGRIVTAGGGRRHGFSVSDVVEIYTPAP